MLARGFGFWMWRLTLAGGVLFLLPGEYSVVMCGAWLLTLVTWPWLRLGLICCCALRLWSQICITCRSCWFTDSVALSCCGGKMPGAWGIASYIRDGYGSFRQPKLECGYSKILFFVVCVVRQNLCMFCLYHNPHLDHRIFDCLPASMAAVQAEDVRASFLFVGDLNGHHERIGWVLRPNHCSL